MQSMPDFELHIDKFTQTEIGHVNWMHYITFSGWTVPTIGFCLVVVGAALILLGSYFLRAWLFG